MSELRLLVLCDIHYATGPSSGEGGVDRALGRELVHRAVIDARRRGGFDAIVLPGDLVDDRYSESPDVDLHALADTLSEVAPETPRLVVPGNHDPQGRKTLALLGAQPGLRTIGGYRCVSLVDGYDLQDRCTRPEAMLELLEDKARSSVGGPLIAIQHNPMDPPIDSDYPYMLTNRQKVMEQYGRAGVVVSISGHYHPGQELHSVDGVHYFTGPSLVDAPHRYSLVSVNGREVRAESPSLALPAELRLVDSHVHTEFAYCRQDVSAADAVDRACRMNLGGLVLAEHAPQLYCTPEDFWMGRHIHEPAVWRAGVASRMDVYRQSMVAFRGGGVRLGLEVELDGDGQLTCRDADRDWADVLIGAIHWLARDAGRQRSGEFDESFLATCRGLCEAGVDVLAHPLRPYSSQHRPWPTHLYGELADLLSATGTAVELNLHKAEPDAAFFAECVRRGVPVALASDAHATWQVGLLNRHLAILDEVRDGRAWSDLLYRPAGGGECGG
jgi:histidinol phosphatase-like PHP family hydrolase